MLLESTAFYYLFIEVYLLRNEQFSHHIYEEYLDMIVKSKFAINHVKIQIIMQYYINKLSFEISISPFLVVGIKVFIHSTTPVT